MNIDMHAYARFRLTSRRTLRPAISWSQCGRPHHKVSRFQSACDSQPILRVLKSSFPQTTHSYNTCHMRSSEDVAASSEFEHSRIVQPSAFVPCSVFSAKAAYQRLRGLRPKYLSIAAAVLCLQ